MNYKDKIKVNVPDNINLLLGKPEINIQFLNGEITIPGRSGGYVVASGCGSGKTTAIKEIIRLCYNQGIVYSAFTIEECNQMYQYCKTIIPEEDIIVLHSNYNDEGVDMNTFRNNPDELANKKVIICTHYKLLNEYPEVFQRYNRNRINIRRLSKVRRNNVSGVDENGIKSFPRQLVLIDEMPTCRSTSFTINKSDLRLLGVMDTEIKVDLDTGREYTTAKSPIHYTNGGEFELTESLYDMNSKTRDILFNSSTELGKLKNTLALSMIYDNYDQLINSDKDEFRLNYTLADQIFEEGDMRFIIFDGTGDLTFIPSENKYCPFTTLTYHNKYNSPITLNKLPIEYQRKFRTERDFENYYERLITGIGNQVSVINEIINEGHKLLIVSWKNLKVKGEERGIPIDKYDKREIPYLDYLRIKLENTGKIKGVDFDIIHYQSGLDKATNEFRDYDSIYFLGEFHVPNDVVNQFNQDYRVNTNAENYLTYQLVQAVCRTRIRKHDESDISIYYTEDWSRDSMTRLIEYLSSNSISEVRDTTLNNIKPKWRPVIELFSNLSPEFRDAIEIEGKTCKIEFTLDEIWDLTREVLPIERKKTESYYPLINYLKKLGIEINITSNGGRFQPKL